MKNFKVIRRNVYKIIDTVSGGFQVVKVLNEYTSEEEARKDLVKLGCGKKSEKEVLRKFNEQY